MGAGASAAEQAAYEQQQQSNQLESKDRLKQALRERVAQRDKESKQGSMTIDGITAVKNVSSSAAAALQVAPKISTSAEPKDVSSEALKALAIGNKGYRDEYREYDDTRTKLTNKKTEVNMDWKGLSPSPRKNGEQSDSIRPSRTGSITTGSSTTDERHLEAPNRPVGRPAPSSSSSTAASRVSLERALGHNDNVSGGKDNRKGGRGPPTIEPPDSFGPGSKHGVVTHPSAAGSDGNNPLQQIIYAPELPVISSNSAAPTTRPYPSTATTNNKDFRSSITPPSGTPPTLQQSMSTVTSTSDHNRPTAPSSSSSSSSSSAYPSNNPVGKPVSGGMNSNHSAPNLQPTTPPIEGIPTSLQTQSQPQRPIVGIGRGAPSDNPMMMSTGNATTFTNKPGGGPQGGFGPQAPTRPSPATQPSPHPNAVGRGGGGTGAVPVPIGPGGVAVIGGGAAGRKLPVRPFPGGPNDSSSFGMEDDDQYSAIFTDEPSTLQISTKTPSNVPSLHLDQASLAKAVNEVPYFAPAAAATSSSSHNPNAQLFPGAQRPNHNPPPGNGPGTSPFPANNNNSAPSSSSAQRGLGLGTNLRVNTGTVKIRYSHYHTSLSLNTLSTPFQHNLFNTPSNTSFPHTLSGTPINGKSNLSFQTAPPPKTLTNPGANIGPGGLPVVPFPGNVNVMQTSLSTVRYV